MLLSFDIAPEAIPEHDHWHTFEHLPERLAIPGFRRGSRWTAIDAQRRYMVLYEVDQPAVLDSDAYLQRLNNPSPWTTRMMPHYRGMQRGLCAVTGSVGLGVGHVALLLRFRPEPAAANGLRDWLVRDALPSLIQQRGIGSAHLLEGALRATMTNEQRIRGADAGVDWALIVTGHDPAVLEHLTTRDLNPVRLEELGVRDAESGVYGIDYTLTNEELAFARAASPLR